MKLHITSQCLLTRINHLLISRNGKRGYRWIGEKGGDWLPSRRSVHVSLLAHSWESKGPARFFSKNDQSTILSLDER